MVLLCTVICKSFVRPAHFEANLHDYTPRQSIVVKDESPKINKLLYKSRNGIKLIFIVSAQSSLARKYLSFICLWFPVHHAAVCTQVCFIFVIRFASACLICLWQRAKTYPTRITSLNVKCVWFYWLLVYMCVCMRRRHKETRVIGCRH